MSGETRKRFILLTSLVIACNGIFVSMTNADDTASTSKLEVELGRALFFDTNLSEPAGQSCGSCHVPSSAFTDPDNSLPTSKGVHKDRFGNRNTPTVMYSAYSPIFHFDAKNRRYVGGQTWDGRDATLDKQAKGPFLRVFRKNNG